MERIYRYLEKWGEDLSEVEPVPVYVGNGEESEFYFPQHHYELGYREILEDSCPHPERLERSLEGLEREDMSYFVERILERDGDYRIRIEPLEHSYAIEWEDVTEGNQDYEEKRHGPNPKFDGLRRSILRSSPRKDDPKYQDIIDRRLGEH